ncbi:2,3-bisphosphoglycerate-independent phosphoglycerate mutase [Bacteroidia bacterium]|nr:2,3-bisphosphoglycerate-independent phosphoglycerate mutase [Bacteroidia bacterium]
MTKKAALIILDGWGIGDGTSSDAISIAHTPFTDSLYDQYPHAELLTDGENVGLPTGQMGNSEVGHMNIGAGRVVWQMLAKINRIISNGELPDNKEWQELIHYCESNQKPLHLMGLVSDGGVHAHENHLWGMIEKLKDSNVKEVYIHAFLDGRDTDPQSGLGHIEKLLGRLPDDRFKLSSVVGRYYAMDRDQRWERVKKAYDVLVNGTGIQSNDVLSSINKFYSDGITDEFMEPIKLGDSNLGNIQNEDAVLCFNFRTDRGRQITRALTQEAFAENQMQPLKLHYKTFTEYDETFKIEGVLFDNENLTMTLGEVLEEAGKTQLRAAETEKYPHVTFFFSGGREAEFKGEHRIMAASPKVATYDLQPEMSAIELTNKAVDFIQSNQPDFICLNYANPDMVGHTGVYEAITKAVETVDTQLKRISEVLIQHGYEMLVIADHGNADFALNPDGSPNTAHSTNPVPVWYITSDANAKIESGKLADVAPSILNILGVPQPEEMTGQNLIHA